MALTTGDPLPNITTTKTTATAGPDWYNTYLQNLAKPGTNLLNLKPEEMVAGFDPLQQNVLDTAKTALAGYDPLMTKAGTAAEEAAKGITPESIQRYMNPYETSVTNEMARQSTQNFQRNLLPQLTGQFVGTGGVGSQRALGALGQMTADVNQNLTGAINKSLADAYNTALGAAGTQAGLVRQGAETEKGVATADLDNAIKQLARMRRSWHSNGFLHLFQPQRLPVTYMQILKRLARYRRRLMRRFQVRILRQYCPKSPV